jgi:hypothetical protein
MEAADSSFFVRLPAVEEPPMMEDLIELVAASFVRHGIECPASDSLAEQVTEAMSQINPAALPEHSYRKKPEAGLAT